MYFFSFAQLALIQILKMKFTVLCSLDGYLLKTFFINKVLLCTYAHLVSTTFKHLVL